MDIQTFTLPTLPAEVISEAQRIVASKDYDPSPEACCARGAAMLDEHVPGWYNHINLDTLQLSQAFMTEKQDYGCVLCQLDFAQAKARAEWDPLCTVEGDFFRACAQLYVTRSERINRVLAATLHARVASYYGFNICYDVKVGKLPTYADLDAQWKALVQARQAADVTDAE